MFAAPVYGGGGGGECGGKGLTRVVFAASGADPRFRAATPKSPETIVARPRTLRRSTLSSTGQTLIVRFRLLTIPASCTPNLRSSSRSSRTALATQAAQHSEGNKFRVNGGGYSVSSKPVSTPKGGCLTDVFHCDEIGHMSRYITMELLCHYNSQWNCTGYWFRKMLFEG